MVRKIKIFAAVILSLAMCCCAVSAEEEEFKVDKGELEFLYEFCSDALGDGSCYSPEFMEEYQSVLDTAQDAIQNYQQTQGEEAYWNLFKMFNRACVYSETPGDFNGDSVCDIKDCTFTQECIANISSTSLYQQSKLGLSKEQNPEIETVTMMQSSMAGFEALENSQDFERLKDNVDTRDITVNSIFYQEYLDRDNEKPVSNGIKIYLSPSNQYANIYSAGNTNEMIQCNKIAQVTEKYLLEHGFEVKRAPQGQNMYVTIDESNAWGADLHLPIHTNALNGSYTGGTMIMIYDMKDTENTKAARTILETLGAITPGPDYTIQLRPDLHELSDINAMSVYVECEYHDTVDGATFIINHIDEIGEAIAKGVCNYYKVEW